MEQPMLDTKSLFAPKKGKQATKGQKQIHEGNKETVKFYSMIAIGSLLLQLILASPLSSKLSLFLAVFAILAQAAAIGGMHYMAKPVLSGPSNTVVDGGIDLNLEAGFADYVKDLIITTAICSGLSIFSNAFWFIWLWLPGFFSYKIWMSVIAPWIFQSAPEEQAPEVADKKRKKMERKMARAGYR